MHCILNLIFVQKYSFNNYCCLFEIIFTIFIRKLLIYIFSFQSSEFFDSVLSLEQDNGFNFMKDFNSSEGLLGNLDDDVFLSSESSSHTDDVRSTHSMSSDSEKYAPMESEMYVFVSVSSIFLLYIRIYIFYGGSDRIMMVIVFSL